MDEQKLLIQLVLIFFSARLLGEIASYFKIPIVIGELVAGIILGPSILGVVEVSNPIYLLSQIGIILLLFEVGIETDIGLLSAAGPKSFTVAVVGVILPFILGFLLSSYFFHFSLLISLFIASTLTATSIGITLRVLRDLKKQNSHEAHITLGAAVLDDIIGIILLAVLYEFSTKGEIDLWNTAKIILFITLFFLSAPVIAKILSQFINKWDEKSKVQGLLPTTIISLIFLFAWIAQSLGAPELLGGFVVGLALSRQFPLPFKWILQESPKFNQRVMTQMKSISHFFIPIFFVTIGLSLDFRTIQWNSSFIWILSGSLILAAILGKLFSAIFLKGESLITRIIIGIAMTPRGEVGLIFANIGLNAGIIENDVYAAVILVITVTTLVAPFFLRGLYTFAKNNRLLS